LGSAMAATL